MLQRDRIITKKIFLIVTMSKNIEKGAFSFYKEFTHKTPAFLRKNKILEIVFGICGRKMESL